MRPPSRTNTRVATSRNPIFCSAIRSADPALSQVAEDADHFLDEQRRQSSRRLIHHQQLRLGRQRLGDAEHLALAAGKAGGRRPSLFAQHRKQDIELVDPRARDRRARAPGRRPGCFPRSKDREIPQVPTCRSCRAASVRWSASASRRSPPSEIAPFRASISPTSDFRKVVLPAPLAPSNSTVSPARTSRSTPHNTCMVP